MKTIERYGWILLVVLSACSKKPSLPEEEKLDVKLSASAIEKIPSPDYTLRISIKSKLPAGGVRILIDTKREDNNAAVYSVAANSSFAETDFTISPLPPGQIYCITNVTVESVATPSNTWKGSFRVLWK